MEDEEQALLRSLTPRLRTWYEAFCQLQPAVIEAYRDLCDFRDKSAAERAERSQMLRTDAERDKEDKRYEGKLGQRLLELLRAMFLLVVPFDVAVHLMVEVCAGRLLLYHRLYKQRKEDELFRPRVEYRSLETPKDRRDRVRRVLAKIDAMENEVRALGRKHLRNRRGSDARTVLERYRNDKVTKLHRMASEFAAFLCEVLTSGVAPASCRILSRALFLELGGVALANQVESLQAGGGLPSTPAGERVLQHFVDLRVCLGKGGKGRAGRKGEGEGQRQRQADGGEGAHAATNPHERHSLLMKAFDIAHAMRVAERGGAAEVDDACHEIIERALVDTPLAMDKVEVGLVDRLSHALAGILSASPIKTVAEGQAVEIAESTPLGEFFTVMNVAPRVGLHFTKEHWLSAFAMYSCRDWLETHDTVPESLVRAVVAHAKRVCTQVIATRSRGIEASQARTGTSKSSPSPPSSASSPSLSSSSLALPFPNKLASLAAESYVRPWGSVKDAKRLPGFLSATACEAMSIVEVLLCKHGVDDSQLLHLARTLASSVSRDVGLCPPF